MIPEQWLEWIGACLIVFGLLTVGAALKERAEWRKENPGMASEDDKLFADAFNSPWLKGILAVLLALAVLALAMSGLKARDLDGRYAQSPNHDWFKSLHSTSGHWCCDIADGRAVADVDWRSHEGHYQVRLEEEWVDVPDAALITVPNKDGRTFVWPGHVDGKPIVNCFMPGSMT